MYKISEINTLFSPPPLKKKQQKTREQNTRKNQIRQNKKTQENPFPPKILTGKNK
jgi:hypothetical protein